MVRIVEDFRVRLDKALALRNLKPVDLARRSGLPESTISQYRKGYAKPKSDKLMTLATVLAVSPSWLMGLDVPMIDDMVPETIKAENITDEEYEFIKKLRLLNEEGKEKVYSYTSDLVSTGRYQKKDNEIPMVD